MNGPTAQSALVAGTKICDPLGVVVWVLLLLCWVLLLLLWVLLLLLGVVMLLWIYRQAVIG